MAAPPGIAVTWERFEARETRLRQDFRREALPARRACFECLRECRLLLDLLCEACWVAARVRPRRAHE